MKIFPLTVLAAVCVALLGGCAGSGGKPDPTAQLAGLAAEVTLYARQAPEHPTPEQIEAIDAEVDSFVARAKRLAAAHVPPEQLPSIDAGIEAAAALWRLYMQGLEIDSDAALLALVRAINAALEEPPPLPPDPEPAP